MSSIRKLKGTIHNLSTILLYKYSNGLLLYLTQIEHNNFMSFRVGI